MCPFKKALPFAIFLHLMLIAGLVGAYTGHKQEDPAFVFTMVAAEGRGDALQAGEVLCPLRPEVISAEVKKWETHLSKLVENFKKPTSEAIAQKPEPKQAEEISPQASAQNLEATQGSIAAATDSAKASLGGAIATASGGDKLTPPIALYQPKPRHVGGKGEVSVTFTITAEGRVEALVVEKGTDAALIEAVERSVKTWKFQPAKQAGKPMALRVRQVVVF